MKVGSALTAALLFLLACAAGCTTTTRSGTVQDTVDVAFVSAGEDDRLHLYSTRPQLAAGTRIQYQYPQGNGLACCARSTGSEWTRMPSASVPVSDVSDGLTVHHYVSAAPVQFRSFVGVATIAADALRQETPSQLAAEKDGRHIVLSLCNSGEGRHLRSSTSPASDRNVHLYYYFGYDVEPDCAIETVDHAPAKSS